MRKALLLVFITLIGNIVKAQLPSAVGWSSLPNTQLQNVCPPGNSPACQNVIGAWSGGVADITRNRLIVWGGGHTDYGGNEVYALDLTNQTFNRLNNPGPGVANGSCAAAEDNGTPNSRHTYGGLAYMYNVDKMFVRDGSLACSAGDSAHDTWTLDMSNIANPTVAWVRKDPVNGTNPQQTGFGDNSDYNPLDGLVYIHDTFFLTTYNALTNTFTRLGVLNPNDYHETGVIDPIRKRYIIMGNGFAMYADVDPNHTFNTFTLNATNCGLMFSNQYPGMAYDPVHGVIVGWAGGNTIYIYNPTTDSCTQETYANGPGAQQVNGTFGRWRYFPEYCAYALVNAWNQNAFILRRQTDTSCAADDYTKRSTAAGVVSAHNFDTATDFQQNVNIFPNSDYPTVFPTQDSSVFKSGVSSLRIDVPPFQGANMGRYSINIPGGPFADNSDIYFQVSTRLSPEMLSNAQNPTFKWPQWKNHSFYNGNTSCTQLDVTLGLYFDDLTPLLYTQCGGAAYVTNGGVPPYQLEQGDFTCPYPGGTSTGVPPTCYFYVTNAWMTFYYHVHLTTFNSGSGVYPNSTIEAWVSNNSRPAKKFISFIGNYNQPGNATGQGFNALELYPYMTGKDNTIGGYPTAHVWYDELIVSSQPIATPWGPTLASQAISNPVVSLSPSTLPFGNQGINSPTAPQTVTLTNTGPVTLSISSIALSGANAANFAISANTCGATLASSVSCTMNITYTPTILGAETASVIFTTNAPTSPDSLPLSGTGFQSAVISGSGNITGSGTVQVVP